MSIKRSFLTLFIVLSTILICPAAGAGPSSTSNHIEDEVFFEAQLYINWIEVLLNESSIEFNEVFNNFNSQDADLEEFTDASTQIADEISNDILEFRDQVDDALKTIQQDAFDYPDPDIPPGSAWKRFLIYVKPFMLAHQSQINALLQQMDLANATVVPSSVAASEIFLRARSVLYKNTLALEQP